MEETYAGQTALIVDHKLDDLKQLRAVLTQLGVGHLEVASSVNMAVSLLREQAYDYCFAVHDLGRNEKSGFQLLCEIQAEGLYRYDASFVLVLEADSKLLFGSLEAAPDLYLTRPYNPAKIRHSLDRLARIKKVLRPLNQLLDKHSWAGALAMTRQAQAKFPALKVYLQRLRALIQVRQQDYPRLLEELAPLTQEREEAWAMVGSAMAYYQTGAYTKARHLLELLVNGEQLSVEAFIWLARIQRGCGEMSAALTLLRKGVMLQPGMPQLQGELANLAFVQGDQRLAAESYRQAIRLARFSVFQEHGYYFGLVQVLLRQIDRSESEPGRKAIQEAIQVLESVVHDFAETPVLVFRARLMAACVYRQAGNKSLAEKACHEAFAVFQRLEPQDQAAWYESLVDGLEESELADEAQGYKVSVMRFMSAAPWGQANMAGMKQFRAGQLHEALESFCQADQARPYTPSIVLNLVQAVLDLIEQGAEGDDLLPLADRHLHGLQPGALSVRQFERYSALMERYINARQKL